MFEFDSVKKLRESLKDGTFSEIIDDWKWIFSYSMHFKGAIVFYTILGIVSTTLGLIASLVSKYVIDIITGYQMDKLGTMIFILLGSAAFRIIINNVLKRITLKLRININNEIQADIFNKIVDSEWLSLSKYSSGDILNRFSSDTGTVATNAISWLPSIIIAVYNFVITFVAIWSLSKVMALISFGTAPVLLIMSRYFIRRQREYGKKVREMSSSVTAFEVETFYNMDTIKSFGVMDYYKKKLRGWQAKFKQIQLDYNMFSIKTGVLLSVVGMIVQYSVFGYCLWLLWTRAITYGTMVFFLEQRGRLSTAFDNLVSVVPNFLNSSISAHRIRELVDLPKEQHLESHENMPPEKGTQGYTIKMSEVDFSYTEGKQVITESAFEAHPGEIVALVGPSGEGKTTMIRLILGLVHPEEGDVTISYKDGEELSMSADYRYLFSYVPQGNSIMSGTVAENLRLAKEDATDEEIVQALKTACAWDFIKDKPDTINCQIGERGRGFSEGQAQRIAIARALLRDAPVMLLDEATSALDVATEREVLRNIITERADRTVIVTTHRPTVLNMCSRIYRVVDRKVTQLSEEESSKMAMEF
ncbi:MAG: ABC transporter ATP-binding protein/permease [Lachnospiraceae bacterium]|nr:ABC transporter ATP-binding protein/permease [Lachnospiraceae bacterium]